MLEACRESNLPQILDIQHLSKALRQALMKLPPIPRVIFELTLPRESEESRGSFRKFYWDKYARKRQSRRTITRSYDFGNYHCHCDEMRSSDGVLFNLLYNETEREHNSGSTLLKKNLVALNKIRVQDQSPRQGICWPGLQSEWLQGRPGDIDHQIRCSQQERHIQCISRSLIRLQKQLCQSHLELNTITLLVHEILAILSCLRPGLEIHHLR